MPSRSIKRRKTSSHPQPRKRRGIDYEALSAKTTHNETQSYLARLPAEIRQIIWRMLIGDRVLHVNVTNCLLGQKHEVRLGVCYLNKNISQIYKHWVQDSEELDQALGDFKYGHTYCATCERSKADQVAEFRAGLNLLRLCTTFSQEVKEVLWRTNLFSFMDGNEARLFIKARTISQQILLRRLQLCINATRDPYNTVFWNIHLPKCDIHRLKSLSELHVQLLVAKIPSYGSDRDNKMDAVSMWTKIFDGTRLHKTTIMIKTDNCRYWGETRVEEEDLTLLQRQQWASRLRQQLLQPVKKSLRNSHDVSWV